MKMKMTATGDYILTQGYKDGGYSGLKPLQDFIARGEARFGNLEICVTDWSCWGSAFCGGIWMSTTPDKLPQILDYGCNFMGFANNHTMDFGYQGMQQTLDNVRKYNVSVTGAGENLMKASTPVYRDFDGGRVAFISICSTFDPSARAGHAAEVIPGRPGLNPLRCNSHITVTREHFDTMKQVIENTQMNGQRDFARKTGFRPPLKDNELDFGGYKVVLSENGKEETVTTCNKEDLERTCNAIRDAKKIADYVVVMIHSHQCDGFRVTQPAPFVVEFCHACIDAGADMLLGGGVHEFKPIELYKGKPIFYSLGNFVFQLRGLLHLPAEHHYKHNTHGLSDVDALAAQFKNWEQGLWVQEECFWGIIPYVEFEDGKLVKAEMLPIDLGFRKGVQYKGLPFVAEGESAKRIFESLKTLSAEKGVQLRQREDGIIEMVLQGGTNNG